MRRFLTICTDAVFPTRCWQCERMYFRQNREPTETDGERGAYQAFGALMADYLCPQCTAFFEPIQSPLCPRCGRPFTTRHGVDHLCPDCRNNTSGFDAARASGVFDHALKTIIHHYKYQGRTELVHPMGRLLWETLHRFFDLNAFDLVLPVPLYWFRQYRRGFNQASLLVRQWKKLADAQGAVFNPSMLSENVLIRRRHTASQTGLGRQHRCANLKDAFAVRSRKDVQGKRILLVDDVLTTGATADACATALKSAGAVSVKVLTLARTV